MPTHRYFLNDFVEIQRKSFYDLLEKGLIDEINKRNPITNNNNNLEVFFHPEYYKLTVPSYTPREAILLSKSYVSKLYIPVSLSDKKERITKLKWIYIGNLPLMTKRGHFILNGAARVIVNQIIRSPGIYYQQKTYYTNSSNFNNKKKKIRSLNNNKLLLKDNSIISKKSFNNNTRNLEEAKLLIEASQEIITKKNNKDKKDFDNQNPKLISGTNITNTYTRYYADLISQRGAWLRLEIDKEKNIWALFKKSPKIPLFWLLIAMGIPEKKILMLITESHRLVANLGSPDNISNNNIKLSNKNNYYIYTKNPPEAWKALYLLFSGKNNSIKDNKLLNNNKSNNNNKNLDLLLLKKGRQWIYNKFMNPRTYDLGKQGRLAFNRKLGLNINKLILTPLDLLYATDYLIRVEKGKEKIDDIDHLKNRRVRTSGELIQIQIGVGFVRLEKFIRDAMNKRELNKNKIINNFNNNINNNNINKIKLLNNNLSTSFISIKNNKNNNIKEKINIKYNNIKYKDLQDLFYLYSLINTKGFNSAIREFFGTSPLSQFMDQINPLAEITHKRRLSSMGPGGVTASSATLDIRGIHPTHYGRICPIETPEGKNTGLVSSLTAYARVNSNGIIESPFYRVYKGQVQKHNIFYFSAEQEEVLTLAAYNNISGINFLFKNNIPARISEDLKSISRNQVQYIGVSPLQMISIATSLIPFVEHDDANRALMGSNMQRQAVPLIRPERPVVGTGLEGRAISDSGHILQSRYSGLVTYVSGQKIVIATYF